MCVHFINLGAEGPADVCVRRCGVDVSLDSTGTAQSAVVRTVYYPEGVDTRYETKVAFQIRDGIARVEGFIAPAQPSRPHVETVPIACAQVANVAGVTSAERPEETLGQLFEYGRYVADQED